jgi:hypothetical protein
VVFRGAGGLNVGPLSAREEREGFQIPFEEGEIPRLKKGVFRAGFETKR